MRCFKFYFLFVFDRDLLFCRGREQYQADVVGATLHDFSAKSLADTDKQGNNAQKLGGHINAKMTARYLRLHEIDIAEPPKLPIKTKAAD